MHEKDLKALKELHMEGVLGHIYQLVQGRVHLKELLACVSNSERVENKMNDQEREYSATIQTGDFIRSNKNLTPRKSEQVMAMSVSGEVTKSSEPDFTSFSTICKPTFQNVIILLIFTMRHVNFGC